MAAAKTIGPSGGFYNNGWGNGYQLPPGESGPHNNAANTLPKSQGGQNPNDGVNNGMVNASSNSGSINNPTGSRLTPADPYSPTPSKNSSSGFYTTANSSSSSGDTLVIGYSADVKGLNNYDWAPIGAPNGVSNQNTTLNFAGSVQKSDIRTGSGNDSVIFNSSVSNTNVSLGAGSDQLIFGGKVQNVTVDLGSDTKQDTVKINSIGDVQGLRINGAGDNDVLYIGSTKYQYNSASNSWVNPLNANDKKTF